jgi:phenylalanyl-tRNA synthetase beta chain
VAGLISGPVDSLQWGAKERAADFFDAKGDVQALLAPRKPVFVADSHPALHPGRCARVVLDGQTIGHVGELHPRWRQSYELPQPTCVFELALDAVLDLPVPIFEPLPRQQSVTRDLALVLGEHVAHDALVACLRNDPAGLVRSASLFDIYKPATPPAGWAPGERSLAVRLELLDADTTLTEDRIDAAVAAAVARVAGSLGGRLRT